MVKNPLAMQETQVWSLGWEDPLQEDGNPLKYPCLENLLDRGEWQATVHGVKKSRKWLSTYTSNINDYFLHPTSQTVLITINEGMDERMNQLINFFPIYLFFSLPVLSRYNWHRALYKFKVYSILDLHTPWNDSHNNFRAYIFSKRCKIKEILKMLFSCDENS